jgi:hypothetical protein
MTIEEFKSTLSHSTPPDGLPAVLVALWHDARGEWDLAHQVAQDVRDADGSWVHAYLHRKEGDASNAAYWYRRASKPAATVSLEEEWEQIVGVLIGGQSPFR